MSSSESSPGSREYTIPCTLYNGALEHILEDVEDAAALTETEMPIVAKLICKSQINCSLMFELTAALDGSPCEVQRQGICAFEFGINN